MACCFCIQIKAKGVNMIYTFCQWLFFFYFYCFLGWIWETCYVSVLKGHWVNRGFMRGPFLPIYGSGAIIVLIFTLPYRTNAVAVFFMGMISATILEYVTGEAVPCQILGLQQSEIESERTYLSYVVSGLGRLLCSFNHAWA